jgi:hypothetical protein
MLSWAEGNDAVALLGSGAPFAPYLAELLDCPAVSATLTEWRTRFPRAFSLLLSAIAADEVVRNRVARGIAESLAAWDEGGEFTEQIDDILAPVAPSLDEPYRTWVVERSGVASRLHLVEGKDYQRTLLSPSELGKLWPPDRPLPPIDTIAGVQARLLRNGYHPGPVTGEWNERTARAIVRFQYDSSHPSPGSLDDLTRSWLSIGESL